MSVGGAGKACFSMGWGANPWSLKYHQNLFSNNVFRIRGKIKIQVIPKHLTSIIPLLPSCLPCFLTFEEYESVDIISLLVSVVCQSVDPTLLESNLSNALSYEEETHGVSHLVPRPHR